MMSLLLALLCSPPTLEGNMLLLGSYMLHYVHQLVANCLFVVMYWAAVINPVYNGFITVLFCRKQLSAVAGNDSDESWRLEQYGYCKTKTMSWKSRRSEPVAVLKWNFRRNFLDESTLQTCVFNFLFSWLLHHFDDWDEPSQTSCCAIWQREPEACMGMFLK